MATQSIQSMEVHSTQVGFAWEAPEAATQTFLLGAVVVWSAGFIQEAGADPISIAGIALRAGQSGASAGAKTAHFTPLLQSTLLEANLANAASDFTSVATDIGKAYGIVKRSSGTVHWVFDAADTTATRVRLVGLAKGHVIGDINARFLAVPFSVNSAFSAA